MVDGITDFMYMSLSKLQELVMHREVLCVTAHEVSRSQTKLSTELNLYIFNLSSWANIDIPIRDDILKG